MNEEKFESVDLSQNPLAALTFLSTPAILTNASCVLLFGTGNRYGRAIDRMHQLAEMVKGATAAEGDERRLRRDQLRAGERRASLIVRALTCFYAAVASFTASTLFCLIGTFIHGPARSPLLGAAFLSGGMGILAIIGGAMVLVTESWFSFRILQQERAFLDRLAASAQP